MKQFIRFVAVLSTILAVFLLPQMAQAFFRNYAPPQTGFTHPLASGDDTPPGRQLAGSRIVRGSTTIADIDGNPANGKEIIVGGSDSRVYAYRQDGSLLWQFTILACTPNAGDGLINTAPAVGDLFGNGTKYVVIGYGGITKSSSCSSNADGGVVAINGVTGAQLWRFTTPFDAQNNYTLNGVLTSPGLSDVDGNGTLEVGFASTNNNIYLLNANGSLRWRYRAFDTIFSSPAFADINGDGRKEMIIGTDFGPQNVTPQGTFPNTYGWLYAFDTSAEADQYREFGEGYVWRRQFDQTINSSPAIADVDNDGRLEVVVGAGCANANAGKWVKVLDAATGADKITLNAPSCVYSSPALGDLNSDGKLEIVAAVSSVFAPDRKGRVLAWSPTNPNPIWSVVALGATGENDGFAEPHNFSPVIADLDGNGSLEVAITTANSVAILRGDNGQLLTTSCSPSAIPSTCPLKSLFMWYPNRSTPAIADIDNDGKLEVAIGGSHTNAAYGDRAFLYVWRDLNTAITSPQGSQPAYSAPWPMFHGNAQHTGTFAQLNVSPKALNAMLVKGTSKTYNLSITLDGGAAAWSLTANDPNGIVQVNSASGTTPSNVSVTLKAPNAVGSYTAQLIVRSAGLPDQVIPVTVISANQVRNVYLPLIRR